MDIIELLKGEVTSLVFNYIAVFIAIMLDLASGIRKAKLRGEYRSSKGLRRTTQKISQYYTAMLMLGVVDAIQIVAINDYNVKADFHIPILPIFSYIGSLFVCYIEFRSITESADKKTKQAVADGFEALKALASNPQDLENWLLALEKASKEHVSSKQEMEE